MSKKSASRIPANFFKSVSILAVGVSLASCASDTVRFTDGFYTGAVPKQNVGAENTPYPEASAQQPSDGIDNTYTASVNRNVPRADMQPADNSYADKSAVQRQSLPAPGAASAPSPQPSATQTSNAQAPGTQKEGWTATGGTFVTMREGETVYNLAKRYGVPANAIMEANNITDAKDVSAGKRVIIPTYVYSRSTPVSAPDNSAAVRSASSDTGSRSEFPMSVAPVPTKRPAGVQVASLSPSVSEAQAPAQTAEAKPSAQPQNEDNSSVETIDSSSTATTPVDTGVEALRWPVRGRVVSSFGSNVGGKGNDGIDISVPRGSAVKAAENGVVIYAGDGLKEFGKTVLVRHSNGLVTVYGHLDEINVERGADVSRGQNVGVSGMTGSAKQPQLHFEVRKNTSPVNPMTYLR